MQSSSGKLFALAGSLILAFLTFASAQSNPNTIDWETIRPEGEEFSVLMPKNSTFEASREPYHKMELNTRTYLSSSTNGPVFGVVSLSGIKSNPALYTEMQRINSYVDAFKNLFSPKVRKDVVGKLTLVGEKNLFGNAGREYRMTIANLSGTAQVFATRKRFYAIVYLTATAKKDDPIEEQFLSSFVLPEKLQPDPTSGGAEQLPDTTTATSQEAVKKKTAVDPAAAETSPSAAPETKPNDSERPDSTPGKREPISGGVLNGKAISLPKPEYPADAKAAGVEGVVVVRITIDELGNVTEAHAVSGPPPLQQPAVSAALQAKFSPTLLSGEPMKVTGVLVFNFGRPMS